MFGWKKKAERLRMVILSAGHQFAKEISPELNGMLEYFRQVSKSNEANGGDVAKPSLGDASKQKLVWEPIDLYGWDIQSTMYLLNGQLWWLTRAIRKNEKSPSESDLKILDKVLAHLGADSVRDALIGAGNRSPHDLPFGWWTWFNRMPLYEIQINKDKAKDKEKIRIVPLGEAESDGYNTTANHG